MENAKEKNEACELVQQDIQKKKKDIVLIFVQENCPYCKMLEEYIMKEFSIPESLIDNLPDSFLFVDVNKCGDYGFDIEAVPYMVRIVNDRIAGEVKGFDKDGAYWLMTMNVKGKSPIDSKV